MSQKGKITKSEETRVSIIVGDNDLTKVITESNSEAELDKTLTVPSEGPVKNETSILTKTIKVANFVTLLCYRILFNIKYMCREIACLV